MLSVLSRLGSFLEKPLFRRGVPVVLLGWLSGTVIQDRTWLTMVLSYLPATLCAVLGLAWLLRRANRRSIRLAGLVAALVLTALVKTASVDMCWRNPIFKDRPGYRLVHWNVSGVSGGPDAVFQALEKVQPTIVVLADYPDTPEHRAAAETFVRKQGWTHGAVRAIGGLVLISKFELFFFDRVLMNDTEAFHAGLKGAKGRFDIVGADVDVPFFKSRREQVQALADRVEHRRPALPTLLVGNPGAPGDSRMLLPFRNIMRNSFLEVGQGPSFTWPAGFWPLLSLDQVWVTDKVRLHRYDNMDAGTGSHRMQQLVFSLKEYRWR